MVLLQCPRCLIIFDKKKDIISHIKKNVIACAPKDKYGPTSEIFPNLYDIDKYILEIEDVIYDCKCCSKDLKTLVALEQHVLECKNSSEQKLIKISNEKIEKIEKINSYTNTDYIHLNDFFMRNWLLNGLDLSKIIKETNFNKNFPENHNIYIYTCDFKYIFVFNGFRWDIYPLKNFYHLLIFNIRKFILDFIEVNKDVELFKDAIKLFSKNNKEFLEAKSILNIPPNIIDSQRLRIFSLLYNQRSIPQNTYLTVQRNIYSKRVIIRLGLNNRIL